MELGLRDKVVVITGGTTGTGKATALKFAREGSKTAVCSRSQTKIADLAVEFWQMGLPVWGSTT